MSLVLMYIETLQYVADVLMYIVPLQYVSDITFHRISIILLQVTAMS